MKRRLVPVRHHGVDLLLYALAGLRLSGKARDDAGDAGVVMPEVRPDVFKGIVVVGVDPYVVPVIRQEIEQGGNAAPQGLLVQQVEGKAQRIFGGRAALRMMERVAAFMISQI